MFKFNKNEALSVVEAGPQKRKKEASDDEEEEEEISGNLPKLSKIALTYLPFENGKINPEELKTDPKVDVFDEVIGYDIVKNDIRTLFKLKFEAPLLYKWVGNISGMLFYGPPGTGKTLIARSLMKLVYRYSETESEKLKTDKQTSSDEELARRLPRNPPRKVNKPLTEKKILNIIENEKELVTDSMVYRFLIVRTSDLSSSFQSEGPIGVTRLFDYIKGKFDKHEPVPYEKRKNYYTVVFIDEIEELVRSRSLGGDIRDYTRALTSFLEGFDLKERGVGQFLLVGATNYPWNIDSGALRRLERKIFIPLPQKEDRLKLITKLVKSFDKSQINIGDIHKWTKETALFSNDDLVNYFKFLRKKWVEIVLSSKYNFGKFDAKSDDFDMKNISKFKLDMSGTPLFDILGKNVARLDIDFLVGKDFLKLFDDAKKYTKSFIKTTINIKEYVNMIYYYVMDASPPKKPTTLTSLELGENLKAKIVGSLSKSEYYEILHGLIEEVSSDYSRIEDRLYAIMSCFYEIDTDLHQKYYSLSWLEQLNLIRISF